MFAVTVMSIKKIFLIVIKTKLIILGMDSFILLK